MHFFSKNRTKVQYFFEICKFFLIYLRMSKNICNFAADLNSDNLTMQDIQGQKSAGMMLTADLQQAVQIIKGAIQRSQARSLQHVNNEVLSLYYGIGQYISENTRHHF